MNETHKKFVTFLLFALYLFFPNICPPILTVHQYDIESFIDTDSQVVHPQ